MIPMLIRHMIAGMKYQGWYICYRLHHMPLGAVSVIGTHPMFPGKEFVFWSGHAKVM